MTAMQQECSSCEQRACCALLIVASAAATNVLLQVPHPDIRGTDEGDEGQHRQGTKHFLPIAPDCALAQEHQHGKYVVRDSHQPGASRLQLLAAHVHGEDRTQDLVWAEKAKADESHHAGSDVKREVQARSHEES